MNGHGDNGSRRRFVVRIVIAVGVLLVVIVWPFWNLFGPAIKYRYNNPVTTVQSRADIDSLPLHVDRLKAPTLSDSDLEYLAGRVSVAELNLGDNRNFTDAGLKHVANIEGLTSLHLSRTNVTDKGIRHLRGLPLTYINLWHTAIGNESLGYIAEMKSMKQLQIKDCKAVTDAGVAKLVGLEHLWMVNLSYCHQITDKSIQTLSDMPQVEFIQVFNCPNVSQRAIDEFLGARAGRTVHR